MEKRLAASDREKLNKGPCKKDTYPKRLGRHEHRTIAEQKIGRSLLPGEIVHHRDTDRHNNSAENLMVFKNQREHIEYHLKHPEEPELLKRG